MERGQGYHIPRGFHPSADPMYYHHPVHDLWFDVSNGTVSRFDSRTSTYVNVVWREPAPRQESDRRYQRPQRPPTTYLSLRLVTKSSNLLAEGSLVMVDENGLTIGRDRAAGGYRLRLAEMETSKFHCQVFYGLVESEQRPNMPFASASRAAYQITDVGSQNGTFLNGDRLSETKTSSSPRELHHMDELTVGTTVFVVHLHESGFPCEACQVKQDNLISLDDGQIPSKRVESKEDDTEKAGSVSERGFQNSKEKRAALDRERRDELNRLKRKYAVNDENRPRKRRSSPPAAATANAEATPSDKIDQPRYVDRAKLRRWERPYKATESDSSPSQQQNYRTPRPSHSPSPAAPATSSLDTSNKGAKMLSKMGWKHGEALGTSHFGDQDDRLLEPLHATGNIGRGGIGTGSAGSIGKKEEELSDDWRERVRQKARDRFRSLE
ncbi:hypothetical protein BZG36_01256 [Bifiguratus adelaidae]|uniref:G-patch domain-containing protein n=1 Tax=Bifiguratus adelaidae TaxID=1938954 RepID=A0A261Y5R9_9FUNG|nr:hypothetical protein BZG36_01256 [Bifiguratus adelaidae]